MTTELFPDIVLLHGMYAQRRGRVAHSLVKKIIFHEKYCLVTLEISTSAFSLRKALLTPQHVDYKQNKHVCVVCSTQVLFTLRHVRTEQNVCVDRTDTKGHLVMYCGYQVHSFHQLL